MEAELYDQLWEIEQRHWWFQARRQIVRSLIRRYSENATKRRLRVCDLGCGTGGNLAALADEHDVVGVEYSPQALEYARRRLGDRVRPGSLPDDVDLPAESFDVVLLTDVLEHIQDDAGSAQTALGLLASGRHRRGDGAGVSMALFGARCTASSLSPLRQTAIPRVVVVTADILLLSHYNALLFPPAAAVRLANRLLPQRVASHGLDVPPAPINWMLNRVMASEARLLGRVPLPFGLSLVAVVRKRSNAELRR